MSLTLYLLRHGETPYSLTGGYCGDIDPELTPDGVRMAEAFAAAYKGVHWQAVYASPKRRTVATARPLCEAAGIEMQLRDGLRELSYGQWEGSSSQVVREQFAEDYLRWLAEPAWNAPTGGERGVAVASRATDVVSEIQQSHPQGNVLVVSHKATIRLLLCGLLGIDLGRYRDRINILAASLSIVRFDAHGPRLELSGDRSHLSEELRARTGT